MASATGRAAQSHTQQKPSESFGHSLVEVPGYCFVSASHTRFTAEGLEDRTLGLCRGCRHGADFSPGPLETCATPVAPDLGRVVHRLAVGAGSYSAQSLSNHRPAKWLIGRPKRACRTAALRQNAAGACALRSGFRGISVGLTCYLRLRKAEPGEECKVRPTQACRRPAGPHRKAPGARPNPFSKQWACRAPTGRSRC
jgi:hypothetical protein